MKPPVFPLTLHRMCAAVLLFALLFAISSPTLAQSDPDAESQQDPHQTLLPSVANGPADEQLVQVAAASDLFISEYIEGSSNNKAIEIYNGTGAAIDLATGGYRLELYSNGSNTVSAALALTGNLADGDVYVVANSSANATILAVADATSGSAINFNGDDAFVLRKNGSGGSILDVIGVIGVDPGTTWGTPPTRTLDTTLRRKSTICTGDTSGSNPFDPAAEWDGLPIDTLDGLGSHTASCGGVTDNAPTVSSTTPSNGATDVATNSNIVINFSEDVTTSGSWFAISCASGVHTASVSGTGQSRTLNPDVDFDSLESCTVTISAGLVADIDDTATNMAANYSFSFTTLNFGVCSGAGATPIHAIQGTGPTSPIVGTAVVVEAVVVGDYEGGAALSGFYLQEEDLPEAQGGKDNNPLTSEGIFVFTGNATGAVELGDLVRVYGTVTEFDPSAPVNPLTELSNVKQVEVCGDGPSITATPINMPVASLNVWEQVEGMLVTIPQELTVTENFNLGRFSEVHLSANGRLYTPTHLVAPGAPAQAQQDLNDRSRIVLDDAQSVQNPDPVIYPQGGLSAANTLRSGDTLPGLTGVLSQDFDLYRIQPVTPDSVVFNHSNPRPISPPVVGGTLKVAAANVLNYFTTLDNGQPICGPNGGLDCRGAERITNPTLYPEFEFDRQRAKIVDGLSKLNADIVGLMELENNTSASLRSLVNGLNEKLGAGTYAYINTWTIGTDAIKVGIIYKPSAVTPVGSHAILSNTVDSRFIDTLNRPTLAQTFRQNSSGELFTIAVNHLKSKGSDCNHVGDPDTGDGQGNCNITRTNAAEALVDWLASDPTHSNDPDFIIVGDLNSYAKEDPVEAIKAGGFIDLIAAYSEPLAAYSYVFNGQSGYLDHALASPSLRMQVTGAAEWHTNADEPTVLDYNINFKSTGQVTSFYAPDAYRFSDHDPLMVGLNLDSAGPVANPEQSPVANGAGWNNSDVTVTWNWSDSGVGIDPANCTTSSTSTGEGELTLTASCSDQVGNEGTATYDVKVDKTSPVVTVTGVSDGATYPYGSVPVAGCNSQDALSQVATPATISVTGGNPDGTGNFTATCSSATDNAGNSSSPVSVNYTVSSPGTVIESCGGYTVYRNGNTYSAPGWTGAIQVGTSSNNTLTGGNGPDLILGLGGNDLITGNGGNDVACGGNGVDLLLGSGGNDFLDGGANDDVLNGGDGDYDQLIAGAGNDTLLDGDGVLTAQGGAGNDLLTIALRNGWRNSNGQPRFAGLAAGYGNDTAVLLILNLARFFVDITGDERDVPPSSQEGRNDNLALAGVIDPASTIIKFEHRLVISAEAEQKIPAAEAGAEYLTEPVGEDGAEAEPSTQIFLPLLDQ